MKLADRIYRSSLISPVEKPKEWNRFEIVAEPFLDAADKIRRVQLQLEHAFAIVHGARVMWAGLVRQHRLDDPHTVSEGGREFSCGISKSLRDLCEDLDSAARSIKI